MNLKNITKKIIGPQLFVFFILVPQGVFAGSEISVNVKDEATVEFDGTSAPFKDLEDAVEVNLRLNCAHANTRDFHHMLTGRGAIVPVITLTGGGKSVTWNGFNTTSSNESERDSLSSEFYTKPSKYIPTWFARPSPCYRRNNCSSAQTSSDLKFTCSGNACPDSKMEGEAYLGSQSLSGVVRLKIPIDPEMSKAAKSNWLLNGGTSMGISISFYQVVMTRQCLRDLASLYGRYGWYFYLFCMRDTRLVPQSASVDYRTSQNGWEGMTYSQTVTFMGGNCGTYTSPLMLYFDDSRPQFTAQANQSFLSPGTALYWPEKKSKAYFLAIDRNNNKIIDQADELFGANGETEDSNGFEVLKKLDTNQDSIIDKKDLEFDKLLLWRDSTADGFSLPNDVIPLSQKGVQSISLKYKTLLVPHGARAKEKQHADFTFSEKNQVKTGRIVDVWFGTVGGG